MDTLTHIAVGGIVGDIFAGRQLGKRAMWLGAAFQSLPDIDFIASFWLDPVSDLVSHRGITHSLLFAFIITPLLALLALQLHRKNNISFQRWLWFIGMEILIHLFLDAFNAYGTGWFEPFNQARISFNAIFVVDPFFSFMPGIAFVALLIFKRTTPVRKWWANVSLGMICIYLSLSVVSKLIVYDEVREIAAAKNISYDRHFTTPTPMNTLLWFVVLENDSGYHVGYRSVFDSKSQMDFRYFPRNEYLLSPLNDTKDVRQLKQFSQGYYTAEMWADTLVFNDLRFGQMIGWNDLSAGFTFHYFVNYPDENLLVVQRGRFAGWDREAFESMLRRIKGN